jgi:LysR family glycine cleavage system transcriptional activator
MKLPPLPALRAFEAVSRTQSVRAAAEELSVTPAAVSQHLKTLEDWLGIALTERDGRGLKLTEAGRLLADNVQPALHRIADTVAQLRTAPNVTRVTSVTSFAAKWLAPRLGHFMARHPKIDLRLSSSDVLVDLRREPFDIAIRESTALQPGIEGVKLFDVKLQPYAAPAYIARHSDGRQFRWQGADLLHFLGREDYWQRWLKTNGVPAQGTRRAATASHWMLVIDAAKAGQGVALLPEFIVENELRQHELVAVDPRSFAHDYKVWLCWPSEEVRRMTPATRAFRDWVVAEVQAADSTAAAAPRPAHKGSLRIA